MISNCIFNCHGRKCTIDGKEKPIKDVEKEYNFVCDKTCPFKILTYTKKDKVNMLSSVIKIIDSRIYSSPLEEDKIYQYIMRMNEFSYNENDIYAITRDAYLILLIKRGFIKYFKTEKNCLTNTGKIPSLSALLKVMEKVKIKPDKEALKLLQELKDSNKKIKKKYYKEFLESYGI